MSRKSTGHTERGLLSAHNTQNGKGDADRSPRWREHYPDIDWQRGTDCGFKRIGEGRHFRKTYGDAKAKHPVPSEASEMLNAVNESFKQDRPFIQIPSPLIPKI